MEQAMPKTSDTEYLSFPILLGDIGGTNARFSILIDSFAEPVHLTTVKTAEYPTIDDAIQQAVLEKTSLQRLDHPCHCRPDRR